MTEMLTAVYALGLVRLADIELAVMNNALTGFGRMDPVNIGFQRAVELQLVQPNGLPHERDSLLRALAYEIQRRIDEGRFI